MNRSPLVHAARSAFFSLLAMWVCAAGATDLPHMNLQIRLEPASGELAVQATITVRASGPLKLALSAPFEVEHVSLDSHPIDNPPQHDALRQSWTVDLPHPMAEHVFELRYRGRLAPLQSSEGARAPGADVAKASERGSFLPAGSGWYPEVGDGAFTYAMQLDLPAGQRGVVPGRVSDEQTNGARSLAAFRFGQPAEGIDLMTGPYRVQERQLILPNGASVRLRTYLHAEIETLAAGYLDSAAQYIERYSKSIGPYPYSEFSIVSSPLPAGLGMPTLTYLGIDVLKLPFIRSTSLGHEVLHNWWGNGIRVDWERGNWCEGLTTFMADYAYKEDEGAEAAREMRLSWLRDYAAMPPERDIPLTAFTSRTHDASQIVGYDKAAYLFLMLRDELGAETFDAGIRRFWETQAFRRAGWSDLREAFEYASGRRLDAFFAQWLDRTGAPSIKIEHARVGTANGAFQVQGALAQSDPPYRLRVPIRVDGAGETVNQIVELVSRGQTFTFDAASRPQRLALDPDLRLFRRLDPSELPPILRQVTLDPATLVFLPSADVAPFARDLAARVSDTAPRVSDAEELPLSTPVLIIGLDEDVDALLARLSLPPRPSAVAGKGSAQVWTARGAGGSVIAVISARDAAALQALARPLPHYGRQSWLVFDGSKAIERGVWPSIPLSQQLE